MSDYRRILVPYDFSDHARAALVVAIDLAGRLASDVHLLHVVQPPSFVYETGSHAGAALPPLFDISEVCDGALQSLAEVAGAVDGFPGKVEPRVAESASIAGAVQEAAEKLDADLIVMGTHGRTGLGHVFLGSVAERTLRDAPCPVLAVPLREEGDD